MAGFDISGTVRMVAGIAQFSDDGAVASMEFQIQPNFMGKCAGTVKFDGGAYGKWNLERG